MGVRGRGFPGTQETRLGTHLLIISYNNASSLGSMVDLVKKMKGNCTTLEKYLPLCAEHYCSLLLHYR